VGVIVGVVVVVKVGFGVFVGVGAGGAKLEQADNIRSSMSNVIDNVSTIDLCCIYPP